jgi:excisionase family DNA binding protein
MDNPFSALELRLESIENSLRLLVELQPTTTPARQQELGVGDQRFNISELAQYLNVGRPTIHRYKNNGVLPFYQAGRTVYFKKHEVDAAISSIQAKNKKGGPVK